MTFDQGQIILNAYWTIEMIPFLHTPKPVSSLPQGGQPMRQRIRDAKAVHLAQGKTFPAIKNELLAFEPTRIEAKDIIFVLKGVLAEWREDPLNISPMIGSPFEAVESLVALLAAAL